MKMKNFTENMVDFVDETKNINAKKELKRLIEKYEIMGSGRNRIVFKLKSGNFVLKFPLCESGEGDNDWEGSIVSNKREHNDEIKYPQTRYIIINGFVCVVMEIVDDLSKDPEEYWFLKEDWFDSVDGGQVGRTKSGHIVAYDYGLN